MKKNVEVLTKEAAQEIQTVESNEAVDEFKGYKPHEELTAKMISFVDHYMLSDDKNVQYNATQSYLKAYGCAYATANGRGGELLSDRRIKKYQSFLLRNSGFNDLAVDNKLKELIFNSQGRDSVVAIREFNKVKGRIVDKRQVTTVDANRLIEQLSGAKEGDDY